jgi:pimeloyl-ACP methyl ester carboxylesterase
VLGNAIHFPGMYLSRAWGATDLGELFRRPVTSKVPALLLVGDLDPRTPVTNAAEIASTLPDAHVVVVENAMHQFDVFGDPAVRNVVARFLAVASVVDSIRFPPPAFK